VSQFVLDDQLDADVVGAEIARWTTARFVRDIRPGEVIKDDRVPTLLHTLRMPTLVTIDGGFWKRNRRSRRYCILYFRLDADEQREIPPLLRRLVRLPEFRTRAARMGKVARVSREGVRWWQLGEPVERSVHWDGPTHRRAERRVE
jgi:hypothetical protein